MKKIIGLGFILAVAFAPSSVGAGTPKYEAFYVFGDSLSDTGNDHILTKLQKMDPAIPPSESPHKTYYRGRFSNGPVAAEYLWGQLRDNARLTPFLSNPDFPTNEGINFAFGGSASGYLSQTPGGFYVPGMLGQVELFRKALKGQKANSRALYAVWTGGNDYVLAGTKQPDEVVANITKAIQTLYSLGAREFLIPNLPDLGLAPLIQEKGLESVLLQLTQRHNVSLARELNKLPPRLPGIKIFVVDLFAVSQKLVNDNAVMLMPPALEFLATGTGAMTCFLIDPSICPDVDITEEIPPFAFWDVMHPTTFVHKHYGEAMLESLRVKK